jgi:hypothetical protein
MGKNAKLLKEKGFFVNILNGQGVFFADFAEHA